MGKYKVRIVCYLRDEREYVVIAHDWEEAAEIALARDSDETPNINRVASREVKMIVQAD